MELCSVSSDKPQWKRICKGITESFCCTAEINTVNQLYLNKIKKERILTISSHQSGGSLENQLKSLMCLPVPCLIQYPARTKAATWGQFSQTLTGKCFGFSCLGH